MHNIVDACEEERRDQAMADEEPPFKIGCIKFEAEDEFQQAVPLISHSAEERIINVLKEISEENKELRDQVEVVSKKLDVMADKLAEATALMKTQVPNETDDIKFPLKSVMELENLDSIITTTELSDMYIRKIWSLIANGPLSKSIKNVMDEGLIFVFNLDGTAGKMALKGYNRFYSVLEMATRMKSPGDCPKKALRKAIQNVKNNSIKKNSRARKVHILK
ncbi:uncharacterized protein LOC108161160 isoform X1 [Drosophila miranda]|uniref:uncharacterized protein LOC108161160 isoform X1 n=2 Tax=Drosophila miranda TaxID=7229 RepID=UPI00143F2A60|nr:uncharacterized protein LOC108161160 isoform X1 [Drosophila miranda]